MLLLESHNSVLTTCSSNCDSATVSCLCAQLSLSVGPPGIGSKIDPRYLNLRARVATLAINRQIERIQVAGSLSSLAESLMREQANKGRAMNK